MSQKTAKKVPVYDIDAVKKILPHRSPFLLIDQILTMDKEQNLIEAVKNVTINEPFFQGHFPDYPVMPGVLIIEALAQAGAVLALTEADKSGQIVYLTGIDKARFKKQVRPGDRLFMKVEWTKRKGPVGWAHARAFVDDALVAYADIMFAFNG